ncbi:MAG: adenylate/guanylate cyclase domain-containing protein [Hyphomicrobiaceae bacterium]
MTFMRDRPHILVVDDNKDNRDILVARLSSLDYDTSVAIDGEDALSQVRELLPDLILLDVMMPNIDGLEVCRRLRSDNTLPFIPIILVTAKTSVQDVVAGLEAGADDYLTKPVEHPSLIARLKSMLRIKALHDEVQRQKAELADWNQALTQRVDEQLTEIERVGRLRRFLSPQVADAIVSSGEEGMLGSHRALIAVLFADIRGFTAFCEAAEPEETIEVLQIYHEEMGQLLQAYNAGVDQRTGDGIMAIFNDPLPCDDPAGNALRMALAMRSRMAELCLDWKRIGLQLGFGIGVSLGYATVGMVGSEGRYEYTANGTTVNLAARLCDEAADGEILLSPRAYAAVENDFSAVSRGELTLKGIKAPLEVFSITGEKPG